MTTTMELQQELFTLKAQIAARVQIAAALQVVNNLTTAQVRKDAHSKAAEQTTEILTEFIDRESLPIMTNQEQGAQNLEFILQQMYTMLTDLTSGEANDIVANSRKNPLEAWRRLQKIRCYKRREEGKPSSQYRFSGTMLYSGTQRGNRTLGIRCVAVREDVGE